MLKTQVILRVIGYAAVADIRARRSISDYGLEHDIRGCAGTCGRSARAGQHVLRHVDGAHFGVLVAFAAITHALKSACDEDNGSCVLTGLAFGPI